jgi:hypothetical protein
MSQAPGDALIALMILTTKELPLFTPYVEDIFMRIATKSILVLIGQKLKAMLCQSVKGLKLILTSQKIT